MFKLRIADNGKKTLASISYWIPENFLRPIRTFLVGHCLGLLFESKCEFPRLSDNRITSVADPADMGFCTGDVITGRKPSCRKVMFLHVSVILFTGGLCPGESLSRGVSVRGVSVQGFSVQGESTSRGVSVRGLCPGGSLSRGSLSRGVSFQGDLCQGDPLWIRQTPVKILPCPNLRCPNQVIKPRQWRMQRMWCFA